MGYDRYLTWIHGIANIRPRDKEGVNLSLLDVGVDARWLREGASVGCWISVIAGIVTQDNADRIHNEYRKTIEARRSV